MFVQILQKLKMDFIALWNVYNIGESLIRFTVFIIMSDI